MRHRFRRLAARALREEGGFGVVEVIVSSVLIALVSVGVYAGIDVANRTTGLNKYRTIAVQYAQRDQDRLRALTFGQLSARATADIGGTVDRSSERFGDVGLEYTTVSKVRWVTDSTGDASCTSSTAQANYLAIESTVTWPGMPIPPIVVNSVMAPPNGSFGPDQGSLAVQVNDRNGVGVAGVGVTLTGPAAYSGVTNDAGCILWGYLPTGDYRAQITKPGYADTLGVASPTKPVTVQGETTTTLAFDYDVPGRITISFQTYDSATRTYRVARSGYATVKNASLAVGTVYGNGTAQDSLATGSLFPFTSPYTVYAGNCDGATPADTIPSVSLRPGQGATATVQMPPIAITVTDSTNTRTREPTLVTMTMTATGSGCSGTATATGSSRATFTMPYGSYDWCVSGTVVRPSGTLRNPLKATGRLTSSAQTGATASTDLGTSRTAGRCP